MSPKITDLGNSDNALSPMQQALHSCSRLPRLFPGAPRRSEPWLSISLQFQCIDVIHTVSCSSRPALPARMCVCLRLFSVPDVCVYVASLLCVTMNEVCVDGSVKYM